MNLITMVPATARFIAQMRGMRRHIVANNVTEFAVFQNWCDENNDYEIMRKYRRGVMKVAKRETAVLIRLSEREKRTLKRKAANYGMTVSDYARTLLINSDDATIKVIDTEPLKKTAHELAKQGTNLNQFMKFLNTYGIKVFDAGEAQRVLAREVETFMEVAEALAALRREADRNNIQIRIDDFDNPDAEQEG